MAALQWWVLNWANVRVAISSSRSYFLCLYPSQPRAFFTEDAMVGVYFLVSLVYVCVGFRAVGAAYQVFSTTVFPVVVSGA